MKNNELEPYFHPTQIVLVDNDIDFLGNLSLQLEADLAYLLFDSTEKALHYINDRETHTPAHQRFFRPLEPPAATAAQDNRPRRVRIDTDALADEMHFSNRFSQISVAMVDYAMPKMNGLQFCARIRDPNIKKILFTGVATESDAIEAFNSGLIDHFIRKSEHRVYETLNRTIKDLQRAHMRDMFASASDVFEVEKPELLTDPDVIELMTRFQDEYRMVEYYLASDPWGFMLVDGDGRVSRLVLSDAAYRERQNAYAAGANAPEQIARGIAAGELILDPSVCGPGTHETFEGDAQRHWVRVTRAAQPLRGRYGWAVFEAPADRLQSGEEVASYHRYLEWMDTMGFSMM